LRISYGVFFVYNNAVENILWVFYVDNSAVIEVASEVNEMLPMPVVIKFIFKYIFKGFHNITIVPGVAQELRATIGSLFYIKFYWH
jgi:hypothetical protein